VRPCLHLGEAAQRLLAAAGDRVAVGEQQAVEVAVEDPGVGLAQRGLDTLGVVRMPSAISRAPASRIRRALSSGQIAPISIASIPGATSSPKSKPSTSGPLSNSCRPGFEQWIVQSNSCWKSSAWRR
jgi:hypothetical protein